MNILDLGGFIQYYDEILSENVATSGVLILAWKTFRSDWWNWIIPMQLNFWSNIYNIISIRSLAVKWFSYILDNAHLSSALLCYLSQFDIFIGHCSFTPLFKLTDYNEICSSIEKQRIFSEKCSSHHDTRVMLDEFREAICSLFLRMSDTDIYLYASNSLFVESTTL